MTGRGHPPSWWERIFEKVDGQLRFCRDDRAPGQGLVGWVKPQKISMSRQGAKVALVLGALGSHGSWNGYGERCKLKAHPLGGSVWRLRLLISSDDAVFHMQTAWLPLFTVMTVHALGQTGTLRMNPY